MESKCNIKPKPKTTKELLKSWYFWKPFLSIAGGALAGFLYYWFVGCASGSCPITSNPYMSMLWGAGFGYLVFNSPCASGKC